MLNIEFFSNDALGPLLHWKMKSVEISLKFFGIILRLISRINETCGFISLFGRAVVRRTEAAKTKLNHSRRSYSMKIDSFIRSSAFALALALIPNLTWASDLNDDHR